MGGIRVAGFEPAASWTQTTRSAKLSYTLVDLLYVCARSGAMRWGSGRGLLWLRLWTCLRVPMPH